MAKLTKKKIAQYHPSDMTKKQMEPILREARKLYNAQKEVFLRNPNTYSYALEVMEDYYNERSGQRPISRLRKQDVEGELIRLQKFFAAKTSTVQGARNVSIEADRRIFGVNEKTGRPLYRMTKDQATDFWAAYHEYISLEGEAHKQVVTSDLIQQALGQLVRGHFKSNADDATYFNSSDFKRLRDLVDKMYDQQQNSRGELDLEHSILAGEGPDI